MTNTPTPALPQPGNTLDRWAHAQLSPLTRGVSTAALRMAFDDWLTHLSHNPAEQLELTQKALQSIQQLASYAPRATQTSCKPCIEPLVQDRRFTHASWQTWPFNVISQSFLLTQQWWQDATTGVRGVSPHHEAVVSFTVRQLLDMISPANFVWTNPEVLEHAAKTGGASLWQGFQNFVEDAQRLRAQSPPPGTDAYQVGKNVAVTPGQVIYRNRLIELIQYEPSGPKVRPEPILIVPSWIMKYYILDLSPGNSLIKYLVEQGHTVFAISWKNPSSEDRDLGMDDYLRLGVMDAIDTVGAVVPKQKIHAVGYCLGGTLLTIAAAAMGRDGDKRLASMSLLAAQTDFTEPGELELFIDDSQVTYLEDIMWDKGYLDSTQMAGAFQLMRSSDLVWSRMLRDYLLGERSTVTDLMAWNADGTRLPYRMHTEYLRRMFLQNDLASGRYPVNDKPVALTDIQCPIYCIGTERDHVAPWRSVHKLHLLADVDITFLLTSGGHNVGIVNPPGVPGRSYQVLTRKHDSQYLDPDAWLQAAPRHEGSWWPDWAGWLQARSGKPVAAPSMGAAAKGLVPICAAPGTYVLQK
ncbi:MAG: alpha/beta fold hydrolase [Rhodoferax sp.]|uniref:PHA/PHB synthase family protein n=1 Tax=Rhodoferax sp. TaxID=50421 RepID=UPI0027271DC7|nr:alpha/beta fold hydrolase [Rhodoferax sp.]MDO8449718.1 alpha/beta fold hydrolase [Rhodoferax sp.]